MHKKNYNLLFYAAVGLLILLLVATFLLHSKSAPTAVYSNIGEGIQQYDGGPTHTYFINQSISPLNMSVGDAIIGTPTLYKGLLLVTTMGNLTLLQQSRYDLTRGKVIAIQENTGRIVWSDTFPDQIMSQPVTAGSVIVVAMGNNNEVPEQYFNTKYAVIGIDLASGKMLWEVNTTSSAMTTPPLYNGNVLEVTMLGFYYIINATTGKVEFTGSINKPDLLSSPVLANGTAYFGASSTALFPNGTRKNFAGFFALNALTGNILWETDPTNASTGLNDACPIIYNGNVITAYLSNSAYANPTLIAFNRSNGSILWQLNETHAEQMINVSGRSLSGLGMNYTQNTVSPLVLYKDTVYANSNYLGVLFAVNASTGKPIWAFGTGQGEGAPNIIDGRYIITLSDGGTLFILNLTNGNLIKRMETGIPHLTSQPIVTRNYVLISGMNGRLETIAINSLING